MVKRHRYAPEVPYEKLPDPIPVPRLYDDGNALALIAKCRRPARKAGWSEAEYEAFKAECTSGDFDHVLQTVMRYFDEADDDE